MQVVHWFDVTAFGKTAETIAEHVKKGTSLLIHGRLSFKPWTTNEGDPRSGAEVSLFSFEFVGGNRTDGQGATPTDAEISEPTMPDYTGPMSADSQTSEPFVNQF